ncbi:MAG: PIG-L family deacetylase [Candidatus Doudnabacteria bacterium]|nr:PIG-L family deacetylase [Candidatus Doudnabacteria bacterium]
MNKIMSRGAGSGFAGKILCVGAHPDDIEFGIGALIIKETSQNTDVKYIIGSLGEAGSNGTPEEREQEAIAAASICGVNDVEFLNLGGDCHIEDSAINAITLAKKIREFKPDIVLAPEMHFNQHPDHYNISKLTHSACRLARYGGLSEIKELPVHKINSLFFYPSRAEWGNSPDVLIDVSENFEIWIKAMEAHTSQMKTRNYINLVSTKAAAWGASIGVNYAVGLWTNDPIRVNTISDLNLSSRKY